MIDEMRVARLVMIVTCACGRIGFDEQAPPNTGEFVGAQLVSELASSADDVGPSQASDRLEVYWASTRSNGTTYSIWHASRTSVALPFSNLTIISLPTLGSEPALSDDGLWLYLHFGNSATAVLSRPTRDDPWGPPNTVAELAGFDGVDFGAGDLRAVMFGRADRQLYEASRPDLQAAWSAPRLLTELSDGSTRWYPCLSYDGLELLFQAPRSGSSWIYRTTRNSLDEPFGSPEPITLDDPSATYIGDPDLSRDGRTLMFAVEVGGQLEVFSATR